MKLTIYAIIFILSTLLLGSCGNDDGTTTETDTTAVSGPGEITFMFETTAINLTGTRETVAYNTYNYKTAGNDIFQIGTCKYYVSNFSLEHKDGSIYEIPDSYYLIDASENNGKRMVSVPNIPAGEYKTLHFSLGIDSVPNHDESIIKGEINPSGDMVWNWNTGYKFLRLDGNYQGDTTSGGLLYHYGGDANYLTFELDFPITINVDKNATLIHLMTKIEQLFEGPNTIDLDENNDVQHGPTVSLVRENLIGDLFMIHHAEVGSK